MDISPHHRGVLPGEAHDNTAREHAHAALLAACAVPVLSLRITSRREPEGESARRQWQGGLEQMVMRET